MKNIDWAKTIGRLVIVVFGLATIFFGVGIYAFGVTFGSVSNLKIFLTLVPLFLSGCVMIFLNNISKGKNWIWVTISFFVLLAYFIMFNN